MFKVEIRKTCKHCNRPIIEKRYRTYCSKPCRDKVTNKRTYERYGREWQRKKRDALASKPSHNKIKCLICKKYYIQVCSHVLQVHRLTAREYKEEFGLDVKRGRVPLWYRQAKGETALLNGTADNLKAGKKYWFKKNSKIAGRYQRSEETISRLKSMPQLFNKLKNMSIRISKLAKELNLTKAQILHAIKKQLIPAPSKGGLFPKSPLVYTEEQVEEIKKKLHQESVPPTLKLPL